MTTYSLAPQGVFATVQGEGMLLGLPTVFVRFAGCHRSGTGGRPAGWAWPTTRRRSSGETKNPRDRPGGREPTKRPTHILSAARPPPLNTEVCNTRRPPANVPVVTPGVDTGSLS